MSMRVRRARGEGGHWWRGAGLFVVVWATLGVDAVLAAEGTLPDQINGWRDTVVKAWAEAAPIDPNSETFATVAEQLSVKGEHQFSVPWDWCLQDGGKDFQPWLSASTTAVAAQKAAGKILGELRTADPNLRSEYERLTRSAASVEPQHWLDLYLRAAAARREIRLRDLRRQYPQWIFTKHHTLGGSHYAYTEGQSDAQNERQFNPGAALCLLDLERDAVRVRTFIEDANGVIRDPDVSWDSRRVLFAWKKSDHQDDYHLYEMSIGDGSVRQITRGLGFADYEGIYLPNDDLLFNSTRCVQTVDCWWTEVSNLYTCGPDGRYLRRLTFDQVHDNFPTLLPDGRIVYTRWEYADRGQLFVQGLFQMNPDGTGQTELYGNNSWFPTSLLHARGIPGTTRIVATFSGHHTMQVGKLGIVNSARGRQENTGTKLIAPIRATRAERIDFYGQDGALYQYPYPLSETEFVAACAPLGWARSPTLFKLYWIAADGRRELLAADPEVSCNQPVPLAVRPKPPLRTDLVDYRQTTGTCFLQDVYEGPGLAGIPRGTIKKLRVIAMSYRAAGVGCNYNSGPAGEALVCTPAAIGNGSWDVKTVLGDATVHPDGSAFFTVPARTPVYFQALDERGYAVQTMRSWLTLQPDENASCVGCHESKNTSPRSGSGATKASLSLPENLTPFHGLTRGFSFPRDIQPILDRQCTRCHGGVSAPAADRAAPDLRGTPAPEALAKRQWSTSYLALVQATARTQEGNRYLEGKTDSALVNWIGAQSVPPMLPPYAAGAARSRLLSLLRAGHYNVQLTPEEMEKLACWIDLQVPFCGDYEEANLWNAEDRAKYQHFLDKRRGMEELERRNIAELVNAKASDPRSSSGDRFMGGSMRGRGGMRTGFMSSPPATFLSPATLAAPGGGNELYVNAATGRQILVVDRTTATVRRSISLPEAPSGLALSPNGQTLYVTAGLPDGVVLVVDPQAGVVKARIAAGYSPTAPVLSSDGKSLFVCDRYRSCLLAVDLAAQRVRNEVAVGREPVAAALTPDGSLLLIASLVPAGPATAPAVAAEVVTVRTDDLAVAGRIPLLNGSSSVRGICVSPDGRYAYVVHTLGYFQLPTTQVNRGWMNASALTILDVAAGRRFHTVLLDDPDEGAANPWDVTCTRDGRWLCVSHAGTHEVSVIDRPGLHRKLAAGPPDVSTDLSILVDLRRRVRLPGRGPRGLVAVGTTLYAAEYFSDTIAAVELTPEATGKVTSLSLGPRAPLTDIRLGEMLFHDAGLCFQRWQSCVSCHPDARVDGLNWDLLNDGLSNPKNTKSLLWVHYTPPAMSLGVRANAEVAVRAGLRHVLFLEPSEADAAALDAYLKSLEPLPSPYRAGQDQQRDAQIRNGRRLFDKAGCLSCHSPSLYTSLQTYDVGTGTERQAGKAFDTPTLVELWRTAPYLHDGRAATLKDVLTRFNPDDRHGRTSQLTEAELDDLIAFLLSL